MQFTVVKFVAAIILGLLCVAPAAHAQAKEKMWRLGVLTTLPRPVDANPDDVYNALLAELRNLGYVEGHNVSIEWRHTEGRMERRRSEVAFMN